MGTASWLLLGRLRRAVKKIKFLLNFNNIINHWHLASMIGASTSKSLRLMSFSDRPGLGVCADDDADTTYHDSSSSSRGRGGFLSRSTSYSSEDNDIDKRAEMFIANFHRQLQIERQVSLELRHCRGNSLQSITPP